MSLESRRLVYSRALPDGTAYEFQGEVVTVRGTVVDHLLTEFTSNGDCKTVRYSQLSPCAKMLCEEAIAKWDRGMITCVTDRQEAEPSQAEPVPMSR